MPRRTFFFSWCNCRSRLRNNKIKTYVVHTNFSLHHLVASCSCWNLGSVSWTLVSRTVLVSLLTVVCCTGIRTDDNLGTRRPVKDCRAFNHLSWTCWTLKNNISFQLLLINTVFEQYYYLRHYYTSDCQVCFKTISDSNS